VVAQALNASGLRSESLELELTESALIDDIEQSADLLRRLKDLGVRVSLDDLGTGYSSLSYLKRFPVDVLKLDRSLVDDRQCRAENRGFLKALIDMAHALGLMVVAEGVETEGVLQTLYDASCDLAQGYVFAKPIPLKALDQMLHAQARDLIMADPHGAAVPDSRPASAGLLGPAGRA
jgi:EAL domain-containing protein (putative c-di-GMP-specific phosphodiesterase class I)